MKEKLRKFLRPRLAVLLAAALLAASLPSAYAVDIGLVPAETWEDAVSGEFTETGTALTSYTCYGSDGSAETVTVDHSKDLGTKENPISIPDEESLIRFGKLKNTEGNYYILDKSGGVYDMQGDTRSMLPLMGTYQSGGTPEMPSGNLSFQGRLIGNGAKIQNACIKAPNGNWTHPGLFGCLKNAEVMDLTVSLTFAKQNNDRCYAGGIAAAARGNSSLQRLTVDLTVAEDSLYDSAGGLVGIVGEESTMTGCTANVTGDLDGWCAGGLVGEITNGSTVTMTGCSADVTGNLNGGCIGGLAGGAYRVVADGCNVTVKGNLTATDTYCAAGGLVGASCCVTLTGCNAEITGSLTAEGDTDATGGLVGKIEAIEEEATVLDHCTVQIGGSLQGGAAGGLVGDGSNMTLTDCNTTVTGGLTAGRYGMSGGLVGGGDNMTLTGCTAEVGGSLTAGEGGAVGGLVGSGSGMTLTDCTAEVGGSLTAGEGGAVGGLVGTAVNRSSTPMGALQEEDAAGDLARSSSAAISLTSCSVKVDGNLTTGAGGVSGGLVGIAIDNSSTPMGALQEEDAAGDLARNGSDVTMSLVNCSAQVGGGLTAGAPGAVGGLVGIASNSTITLTDCSAQVTGGLTAAVHEDGAAGSLVGIADSGAVTLTDCAVQAVITKPNVEGGSYAPSGPVGAGNATFSGTNITTLRMGADSSVSLALVNDTALTLDDSGGVLTATGNAASSETTGSVEITSGGSAGINVHGGAGSGGATYTLTGVNGTIRLEDKTGDTPAEYWVTLDAGFNSTDPDPLTRGDAVDLLGEAGNRTHTVTVEAGAGGTVSGGGTVARNQKTTVTATPDSGYRFAGWTENGQQVSTEASYTFPVTSSRTLTAVFETATAQYTVTVQAGTGGSATGGGTFDAGTRVTVTANPDSGYRFVGWTESGQQVSSEASYTFAVTASRTLTAVFETITAQYTVTVQAGTGGSAAGGGTFDAGTEATVTANPDSGYRFVNWTENGQQVSTEASYTFAVTSNRTLTAVFERASTGGSSGGGSYTPPKKDEPQTGSSGGWKDIQKELEETKPGDDVDVTMNGATQVPKEVLESIAGKDVNVNFDMGGGIVWTVNGKDIPAGIGGLNLGIRTGSSSIPVNVFNTITGEKSTMQFTLAHSGPFGTVLHLSLNLGAANRGYWANLYWFDEGSKELVFQHACRIDGQGMASWPFDHASSYAVVIDGKNHDPAWENPFADVDQGDWYYEAVRFVCERGLMNGYEDGRFGPNDTLSRAQLAQILFNKEGKPVVNYLLDFSDVAGEAWYTEAIRWAASQGIVGGYGNGTFGPNDPITREQLAVMLWRYSGSPAATDKELHFADTDEISPFALEAMHWAVENGILNGYGDGRLGPKGQATRAQVAQMLKNFDVTGFPG